jgi:glutaredoxin 3
MRYVAETRTMTDSISFLISRYFCYVRQVVVFSKTYCPYCTATKSLFKDLEINAKVIELDVVSDGDRIQSALLDLTGQRTVPNVFIKGKHLGGNDKTQEAARTGKLQQLLTTK